MKRLLLVLVLCCAAYAKDRVWQTGKLTEVKVEAVKGDSSIYVNTQTWGATGAIRTADEINYFVWVNDGTYEYYAGRKLYNPKSLPLLVENAPIKFATEKDVLILLGDDGKEFKLRIAKKRRLLTP